MSNWVDLLFYSDYDSIGSPEQALFLLLLAFVIGQMIGWTYMWTHRVLSYSQTFTASLVVMPVLVALMMMLMAGSMFIAFGLLAVFAVVRFRNVLKDTRDTYYILWAIVEGMAVGTRQESTALVGAFVVILISIYLRVTQFGSRQRYDVVLNLLCAADANLNTVLKRHSRKMQLAASRKVGEGIDMSYRLQLRDPSRSHELQTELENTEGVQRVSLFMREDESEV
ncbi:MAG: DUF4956 domain-containing protein [Planctomycetaceae bacterium]|nr:DUF4956 domain-containing protein [Planctomycetaceae bacterium]